MNILKRVVLGLALAFVGFILFRLFAVGEPQILGLEGFQKLGARTEVRFVVRGPERISAVRVEMGQEGRWQPLLEDTRPERSKELIVTVEPEKLGFADGTASIRIQAQGAWFRSATVVVDATVDTIPPALSVLEATRWIKQGGAGGARLKVQDAATVYVDDGQGSRFAARQLGEGRREEWVCLFAAKLAGDPDAPFVAVARDDAGNETRVALPSSVRTATFPVQTIHLSDPFLEKKVKPMLGAEGERLEGLQAFRRVNEGWRKEDETILGDLGTLPPTGLLWDGQAFSRLPNSKSMAQYGDFRRYYYATKEVSTSHHLGYDLASIRQAEVPAAAAGAVVFAGPLKIYGNTVVLDHGLGLMTLYSHLSDPAVREGDIVLRDATVGRTGSTGFAFGDHLHFGVLVGGLEVNPLEWWDGSWIANNLKTVLEPAFPGGGEGS